MDDLEIIECVERMRRQLAGQGGVRLSAMLEALRLRDYRNKPDEHFLECAVAVALGVDLDAPADRRTVTRILAAREQRRGSGASSGLPFDESPIFYELAPRERRVRLSRTLKALAWADASRPFWQKLEAQPNLRAALRFVWRALPALGRLQGAEFLVAAGYPAAVPRTQLCALLERLGVTPAVPGLAARRAEALTALEHVARVTGIALSELDLLCSLFSGARRAVGFDPVCTRRPQCDRCAASGVCSLFLRKGAPEPRPSMPIRTWAPDERPRERLAAGMELSNAELLAILLRTGAGDRSALDLARELLRAFGDSLHRLQGASPAEIAARVKGIGAAKAAEIKAAIELGRRASLPEADERAGLPHVQTSDDVFRFYRSRFKNARQEAFMLLALNSKNRVTKEIMVSTGTLNASIVHPRDVFRQALAESPAAIIFVHNHPSGDPEPSPEDRTLTARLAEAGRLLGIRVLDHVIIGSHRHFSFAETGAME